MTRQQILTTLTELGDEVRAYVRDLKKDMDNLGMDITGSQSSVHRTFFNFCDLFINRLSRDYRAVLRNMDDTNRGEEFPWFTDSALEAHRRELSRLSESYRRLKKQFPAPKVPIPRRKPPVQW